MEFNIVKQPTDAPFISFSTISISYCDGRVQIEFLHVYFPDVNREASSDGRPSVNAQVVGRLEGPVDQFAISAKKFFAQLQVIK